MPHELAEMRLTRRLVAAGVPPPVHQHEVHHHGRLVARLDLAWPHARVGYELDSRRWHSSPAAHQRDLVRHNALRALGWTVFQATPAQLRADGRELAAPLLAWFDNPRGGVQPCA
jgi:very-short-patch-repair endonuclease